MNRRRGRIRGVPIYIYIRIIRTHAMYALFIRERIEYLSKQRARDCAVLCL